MRLSVPVSLCLYTPSPPPSFTPCHLCAFAMVSLRLHLQLGWRDMALHPVTWSTAYCSRSSRAVACLTLRPRRQARGWGTPAFNLCLGVGLESPPDSAPCWGYSCPCLTSLMVGVFHCRSSSSLLPTVNKVPADGHWRGTQPQSPPHSGVRIDPHFCPTVELQLPLLIWAGPVWQQ